MFRRRGSALSAGKRIKELWETCSYSVSDLDVRLKALSEILDEVVDTNNLLLFRMEIGAEWSPSRVSYTVLSLLEESCACETDKALLEQEDWLMFAVRCLSLLRFVVSCDDDKRDSSMSRPPMQGDLFR